MNLNENQIIISRYDSIVDASMRHGHWISAQNTALNSIR